METVSGGAPGVTRSLHVGCVETPLGRMWLASSEAGLRVVTVPGGTRDACLAAALRRSEVDRIVEGGDLVEMAAREIAAYFAGGLWEFSVPLDLVGTAFQQKVWEAVRAVPYGETATYQEIAARIGAPRAVRAVGAANGANPAAVIVPCHRLVGADGSLRGYGGGIATKRALLELEARHRRGGHDISR